MWPDYTDLFCIHCSYITHTVHRIQWENWTNSFGESGSLNISSLKYERFWAVVKYTFQTQECLKIHTNDHSQANVHTHKDMIHALVLLPWATRVVKTPTVFLWIINPSLFWQSIGTRGGRKGQAIIDQHTYTHTNRKQLLRMMSMEALFSPALAEK